MQKAVVGLMALGRFPSDLEATEEHVAAAANLIEQINRPVSKAEALELVKLFGPDTYFGLAWSLLHLVETCADWPLDFSGLVVEPEWAERLIERCE
jgi:hypothetical protein